MSTPSNIVTPIPESLPPLAPAIKEFLDEKLPNTPHHRHTLMLGERHDRYDHINWIRTQLPRLKKEYGVTTIGLEQPGFMNVLLWSYQDGTLQRTLGKNAARAYFSALWEAGSSDPDFLSNNAAEAKFAMAAMDLGIRVVAYDCRDAFQPRYDAVKSVKGNLSDILKNVSPHSSDAWNNLQIKKDDFEYPFLKQRWRLREIKWLRSLQPNYATGCDAIEHYVTDCQKEIKAGRMSSDGAAAMLYDHLAVSHGNGMTLGGLAHIDGMGEPDGDPVKHVHGLFSHHLFSSSQQPRPHTVNTAIVTTTAPIWAKMKHKKKLAAAEQIVPSALSLVNFNNATIEPMPQPALDNPHIVTAQDKFTNYPFNRLEKWFLSAETHTLIDWQRKQGQMNPTHIPIIKRDLDTIGVALNKLQTTGISTREKDRTI